MFVVQGITGIETERNGNTLKLACLYIKWLIIPNITWRPFQIIIYLSDSYC